MFTMPVSDAIASTVSCIQSSAANKSTASSFTPEALSEPKRTPPKLPPTDLSDDNVRHMLFGTREAVEQTVRNLHSRGYAEPNDWSPAISTGRADEVMRLLVKRV